jgi:1-deoxy-D-xylulose-5-phosphate reductoisomerase
MIARVTILGATGSVGRSTAAIIADNPERFAVAAVVGGADAAGLAETARRLRADFAAVADADQGGALAEALAGSGIGHGAGPGAVAEAIARDCDIVVGAIAGTAGLAPTHAALRAGRRLALANKECLVCAGAPFMRDARRLAVPILPVDSEHNALAEALDGRSVAAVERMTITASGGPFRTWTRQAIAAATRREALAHPVWSMGVKLTIDSASLMNKGLELIEAKHLFDVDADRLGILVHPQSIVHGLVSFRDGAVVAVLGVPDMRIPIAQSLGMPKEVSVGARRLDLAAIGALTFEEPDLERFPALALAWAALRSGGACPTVLNAANEIAVAAFLEGRIGFATIAKLVEATCDKMEVRNLREPESVGEALSVDHDAKLAARALLPRLADTAS